MHFILAGFAWLLTYLLHSTVFLSGAALLAAVGAVRSHQGRDTLWKVALLGGLLTATAQSALRLQPLAGHVALAAESKAARVDVARVRTVRIAPAVPESTPAGAAFASAIAQRSFAALPAPHSVSARAVRPLMTGVHVGWPSVLLYLWLACAAGLITHLWWRRSRVASRLRSRRGVTGGPLFTALAELCREAGVPVPALSVSDQLRSPIALRREICVPARAVSDLSPAEQRAVLAHELGHIVRKDPVWLAAACLIEHLCFVQPLNRLARRRLREAAEFLCDDWAAQRTGGMVLARCLARVAEWVQQEPAPVMVVAMAGRCSELVRRVERLVEGAGATRPARLLVRAGAGVLALLLVAWSVPGVSAEAISDLRDAALDVPATADGPSASAQLVPVSWQHEGWGEVRDGGRLIVFAPGYSARLVGSGRLGFRQYGRAIVVPENYRVTVNGRAVSARVQQLCGESGPVRLTGPDGAWELVPVHLAGAPQYADTGRDAGMTVALRQMTRDARRLHEAAAALARGELDSAGDAALDGEADQAIDTLVQMWVHDPEAVRRAARRIALSYDKDLRPQFESLGVELGRELSPELQRLTDRMGRDLTPEFARMGAAIGASIVQTLGDDTLPKPKGSKH